MKDVTNFEIKVTKHGVIAPFLKTYDEAYEDLRSSIIKLYFEWLEKYTTDEELEQMRKKREAFLADEAKIMEQYKELHRSIADLLK